MEIKVKFTADQAREAVAKAIKNDGLDEFMEEVEEDIQFAALDGETKVLFDYGDDDELAERAIPLLHAAGYRASIAGADLLVQW